MSPSPYLLNVFLQLLLLLHVALLFLLLGAADSCILGCLMGETIEMAGEQEGAA